MSSSSSSSIAPKASPWASLARAGAEREAVRLEAFRVDAERVALKLEAERQAKWSRPPPASTAHRHAIESILAFLSLSQLIKATRVCTLWLSAAHHMRPIGAKAKASLTPIPPRSVLLRHISILTHGWYRAESTTEADALDRAVATMPHLHTVSCLVTFPRAPLLWPASLTDLTMHCGTATIDSKRGFQVLVSDANAFFRSFRAPLLRRLHLSLEVTELPSLDLCFVTELKELADLTLRLQFNTRGGYALTELQVDTLRQLTQLTTLRCPLMHSTCVRRLLRPPHQLKLARAPLFFAIDAKAGDCLASLPSLIELDARLCSSVAFLSKLPLLATLRFDCHQLSAHGGGWLLTADDVVEGLSTCSALTELTLIAPLRSAHMIVLLPRLPLLRTLVLDRMSELESLQCFSSGPITARLTSLTLSDCMHADLELNELGHLHALRNLQRLELYRAFNEALTRADIRNYTPPSSLFPHLAEFYTCYGEDTTPYVSEEEPEEQG